MQAIIDWSTKHNFALSANLHGGALVVSYPFDACDPGGWEFDCPTPEDPTSYNLARAIADHHLRMSQSPYFRDGVTRGSEWYTVLGGMQVRMRASQYACVRWSVNGSIGECHVQRHRWRRGVHLE